MKLAYLEKPIIIPLYYKCDAKNQRTFVVAQNIIVTLSDGRTIIIPEGYETDLASIPNWAWSVIKPIDKAFIADLIHDYLWSNKVEEIKYFGNNIFKARKFADFERTKWRIALAPEKKLKNFITHEIIRHLGGFFYSRQINIPG
jgi:hypothetical protein